MLWDIIRDFIVQYFTGGTNSDMAGYGGLIGYEPEQGDIYTDGFALQVGDIKLPFGDWLATTITAVIMILLVVFAVWLVRWIFKAVSSAFLLK